MLKLLLLGVFLQVCQAILGSLSIPDTLTLPNLLEYNDIFDLDNHWSFFNNIKLDTGRLIIGKLGGSIWSKGYIPSPDNEWTIEAVLRSSGTTRDLNFVDFNGISLFLVDKPNLNDYSNFGGPTKFDGIQFLINNKEKQGLKIFTNDNSKSIENEISMSIGNCEFPFINSDVPLNLRVSYSSKTGIFKVQIDNNLYFKTDKIKIPSGNYQIGIAGNSSPGSEEFFEILKLNFFDHLTEDAIDDHGLMSDGELKVAVEKVVKKEQEYHPPSYIRESLMERTRRLHEELKGQQSNQQGSEQKAVDFGLEQFDQILTQGEFIKQKLDGLELVILDLQKSKEVVDPSIDEFKNTISKQFVELLDMISNLNQKVIGEVREQQYTMEELGKKVDLLMANHKEIQYQSKNPSIDTYDSSTSFIRWILISIIIVILVLVVFVYRLRRDVKHSKLL